MTDLGAYASAFDELTGVDALAEAVHGLLLHQHWARAYGQDLSPERRDTAHIRRSRDLLDAALRLDPAAPTVARPPERRVVGVCQHFSVLATAALRSRGVAARARCGFATYFEAGKAIDHWIVEYWRGGAWVTADFQIDAVHLHPDFEVLDQPKGKFLRAGEAWQACRRGDLDPQVCGIFDEGGYWFLAQNLVRDLAALNNMEMLPWDVWGIMPAPTDSISSELLANLDRLAELTADAEAHFDALHRRYRADEGLRVPAEVRNAVRQCIEPVFAM